MNRIYSNIINLILIAVIGLGLAGCTVTNAPMGSSSPWQKVVLNTEANPLDIGFVDEKKGFLVGTDRLILETNDGGDSWEERKLELPVEGNFRLLSICAIKCLDSMYLFSY